MFNDVVTLPDAEMGAYLYNAHGEARPGVVILQEIFGVNEFVRLAAKKIADEGYIVLAPDLYHRIEPGISLGYDDDSLGQALALYEKLDQVGAQNDAEAAIDKLRAHPNCNGKIAAVGFCLGGKVVLHASINGKIDAGISFYPVEVPSYEDQLNDLTCPIQVHLGGDDPNTPENIQNILSNAMSNNAGCEYFLHAGAKHGFFNPIRETAYHAEGAKLAFKELSRFLKAYLKE